MTEPFEKNGGFEKARALYQQARAEERKAIVHRLSAEGYGVSNSGRAGLGRPDYKNGGALNPPHDLSGWKWVDAVRSDGLKIRVMLQSFDQDEKTKNEHVLFDRLSYGAVPAVVGDSRWLTDTGLELPLDSAMLDQLVKLLRDLPR